MNAHPWHPLVFLQSERRWFCRVCGTSSTENVSAKMREECHGHPKYISLKYKLHDWMRQAEYEAWNPSTLVQPDAEPDAQATDS